MAEPTSREPRAAGVFVAFAAIAGAVGGVAYGQPSAGVVVGVGVGLAIAIALWLVDRRR